MGNFTKLAFALSLPLAALSVSAAPTVEKVKTNPDIANMRYQARNYRTLFNSERSARIDEINKRILKETQKGLSRAASVTPDFTLPASDQYEYIDGPNGSVYFYSVEFVTEDVFVDEDYTRKDITGYKFSIYDTDFNVVGEIKGKVELDTTTNPANPETRVASMGLTPIITKKFFNSDDKMEVMVYFNMNTPDNTVNCRSVAYQIGGRKDAEGYDIPLCSISGNLCDVLEAPLDKWSEDFYLSFATDYEFPIPDGDDSFSAYVNSRGVKIETYKKVSYGSSVPTKFFEFTMRLNDWPGDQESATPLISRCINGKPYFITNGYTDGLWVFEEPGESGFSDQTWNENTKFFVDIYQPTSLDNPNLLQHTEIDVEKSVGDNIFATFYYLGNLSYRDDVNFEFCDEPGKANLVITTKDWAGAEMGTTSNYYLYGPDGSLKSVIGTEIEGFLGFSDIAGQEPEYMFVKNNSGSYSFEFINPFTGKLHHIFKQTLLWNGQTEGLLVNADRIPDGDSYKYCFELRTPGYDSEGNDILRLAWVNTDGEITGIDEVNMGRDIRMAKVYIDQDVLSPFMFDTTPEREYMIIVKRGDPFSSMVQEEFFIGSASSESKPAGQKLLEVTPDDEFGNLVQISVLNTKANPVLWVMYYNVETDKYSQEFFRLPLSKFAGGDGTAANPYKIASVGDLQCVRDNLSACYEIVDDLDGNGMEFLPMGSTKAPFTGTINGNGHIIKNLTIAGSGTNNAMFSYLDNATISGITFLNPKVRINGTTYNALVASQAQRSKLTDIHIIGLTVDSQAEEDFGSIVNTASLNTEIKGCSVTNTTINMPNGSVVGGLVGDTRTRATIVASAFSGSINARSVAGGILGSSSANAGPITDCHVDADITADNIVGGIVGEMDARIVVDRCYVEGNLSASKTFGTKIVNKGYAVGGIAGLVSNYYDNQDASGDAEPTPREVITNCLVNLKSITTPELPEGHQSSVHRIAGFTSINNLEPDWDNIVDADHIDKFLPTVAEAGFRNNYAVASLAKVDGAVEAAVNTTEGKDVDEYDLNADFFTALGFKFGNTSAAPWNEVPEYDPSLYHEFGSKFVPDEITAVANSSFVAELLVISRTPLTLDSFIDGFAGEVSNEEVVEMTGEVTVSKNIAAIGFNALKAGEAEFTANVNGNLAKVKITVVPGVSGLDEVLAPGSALKISFDGVVASAPDALLEVFSVDGKRVAAARNSISLASLANGVYVISARDAAGNKATAKFFLQ